ncbi:MAG TPA: 50S ribosomal protein L37ae [Candidatus Nanoarchaeia archaeon]|nr:50S ribosomal protein L37ae [Candidatus Nanoarchaeia archaeon]
MASGTKKVGLTGRFGVRYGLTVRQRFLDVEKRQKIKNECPSCHKAAVKRLAKGIWSCMKCSHTFAGKAFALGE